MPLHPRTCSFLYSVSCLLDALDGYAARILQQSTRFGAVLDMVIDRCTTSCLLVFLSLAFPRWAIVFQCLIALDFSSHYMHMYATLVLGGADSSHKDVDKSQSRLLNLYYTNKVDKLGPIHSLSHVAARNAYTLQLVLFLCCALNELFLSPYTCFPFHRLCRRHAEQTGTDPLQPNTALSLALLKKMFPHPFSAGALEIARANKLDSFWPSVLVKITFPVMAAKQLINIIQLIKASKWLAEVDIKSR
jgi:CDP-diacylglycerol--inositol 3-phosphatidyltransferase